MTAPRASRVATLAPILRGAARGFRRFPVTVIAGAVAATAGILLAEKIGDTQVTERLMASAVLGLSLSIGLRLFVEGRGWRGPASWLPDCAGVLVLAAFFVAWPGWSENVRFARVFQLGVVFHLFVAVAPYVRGPEGPGFWEYNRALFERAILAALYAFVLFAGAALAVLALEQLFGVAVSRNAYARLWFLAAFLLSPWLFVAGLPERFGVPDGADEYPRGLRAFTRFALLPIVAVYLLILLVYFVKVLVTWQWPSGWIGWLVSAVAVGGIFSLLLVHPLAERPADRWVRTYARGFYLLLLPAIVMLWLAIWQRVAQYGVTERRYFLFVLSAWLFGVALYQLATRARGIRVIPATLCAVGLLTFAGPWGAYRTSERSQVGRLADILRRQDMLVDGRAVAATHQVPMEARREITAILRYLGDTHGFGAVAAWFPDSVLPRDGGGRNAAPLIAALGIEPVERLPSATGPFNYTVRPGESAIPVGEYDLLVRVPRWAIGTFPDTGWAARGSEDAMALTLVHDGVVTAVFPLAGLLDTLRASGSAERGLAPDRLVVESTGPRGGRLYLRSIGGRIDGDRLVVTHLMGDVLLAGPPPAR